MVKENDKIDVEIIFGDGDTDRSFVKEVLTTFSNYYCELRIFIPEAKKTGQKSSQGLAGIFDFIKSEITMSNYIIKNYIAFIDREHIVKHSVSTKKYIQEVVKNKLGVKTKDLDYVVEEIVEDKVYRIRITSGQYLYLIILGKYFCIEDEILAIIQINLSDRKITKCPKTIYQEYEILIRQNWDLIQSKFFETLILPTLKIINEKA